MYKRTVSISYPQLEGESIDKQMCPRPHSSALHMQARFHGSATGTCTKLKSSPKCWARTDITSLVASTAPDNNLKLMQERGEIDANYSDKLRI